MPSIDWRTYRNPDQAPVPVLRSEQEQYDLVVEADFEDVALPVQTHTGAVGARTGRQKGEGSTISASWLREEPVVLNTESGRRLAVPTENRPLSIYDEPRLVGPQTVLAPRLSGPFEGPILVLEASPLGDGVFVVEPGYRGTGVVRVEGRSESITIDYAPVQGAFLAWSENGEPVPEETPLQFLVSPEAVHRFELKGRTDAVEAPAGGQVWARAKRQVRELRDVRRLPEFKEDTKWDSLDQAYYDGRPVPYNGHLWRVRTAADPPRVREAVRRTMPASSVYRIETLPEEEEETTSPPETDIHILDDVTGAALGYSVEYINSSYNEPVLEARRGDGTNYSFEFRDFTPTELTDGTIGQWAAQADGTAYLSTFYDQSGSGLDATISAFESQPLVAQDGGVVTRAGTPAILQPGDKRISVTLATSIDTYAVYLVGGADDADTEPSLYELGTNDASSSRRTIRMTSQAEWEYVERKFMAVRETYSPVNATGTHSHIIEHGGSELILRFDGEVTRETTRAPGSGDTLWLLNDANRQNYGGYLHEFVLYDRWLSEYESERLAIAANQRFTLG